MAEKKIIAVTGATGAQGGGLARAILDDPSREFALRAVTRGPGKDAARALADRGAEVVQADLDDEASLRSAFDGAYGAYCLTNFWEHFSGEKETTQGGNLARAAAAAGVQHAIWSTFEDTRKSIPLDDDRMPTLQEKYKVVHFDAKADADHFFTDAGVPTTFLLTSFYWENFIFFGLGPKRGENGVLAVTYPMRDKKIPSIAVEDIGKRIGIAGEHLTGVEMAAHFTRALERQVRYNAVPPEVFRSFGFPGAEDIGNMFQFNQDFEKEVCGARDPQVARGLNPELQTFAQWLGWNKSRIPLE